MMLEAKLHQENVFVTLTYNDENLPKDLSVRPAEISRYVKQLRNFGFTFRYFAVGEYGDIGGRPHYHVAQFGFPSCHWGLTRVRKRCCDVCEAVERAWGRGKIQVGSLEPNSMAYVAGYINKKMTRETDPRLEGRRPEFARMSKRPAIGLMMMHEVASTLMEHGRDKDVDVPVVLEHGGKKWPLSRYLRRKLRTMIGREENAPEEAIEKYKEQMQPLRMVAFENSAPLKAAVLEESLGRRINIVARSKRYKRRDV